MIKKLFLTAILLCFSYVGFSQNTPEQMAEKLTSEIAKVLSLDEVQKQEVYAVQLDRFTQAAEIRQNHEAEPQIKNAKLKKVYNKLYGKMKAIIGKERMQKWSEFKKQNK
tara:strand:+ start:1477 stop:1806 length:330 start_codon:yes stop_codon:yes gene_type:complete